MKTPMPYNALRHLLWNYVAANDLQHAHQIAAGVKLPVSTVLHGLTRMTGDRDLERSKFNIPTITGTSPRLPKVYHYSVLGSTLRDQVPAAKPREPKAAAAVAARQVTSMSVREQLAQMIANARKPAPVRTDPLEVLKNLTLDQVDDLREELNSMFA